MVKDKDLIKDKKVVKVKIKEGITDIDGKEVINGCVELPEDIALYKIAHKSDYYLGIYEEKKFEIKKEELKKEEPKIELKKIKKEEI